MNLRALFYSFVFFSVISLLLYGFSVIGSSTALVKTPIDSFWKLFALSIAFSLIAGFAYPSLRGVKKGDQLIAFARRESTKGGMFAQFLNSIAVNALESGRLGERIKIRLADGTEGEGIITSYGGTFSPPSIKLTETEILEE